MPQVSRPKAKEATRKKIEPVLKGETPDDRVNIHKTSDIRYFLEQLIGESVSKELISDVFNMLFLPVPRLKEEYSDDNKDHYEAMKNLLSELSSLPLRKETVSNMDKSTVAAVNIISNLINSMKQMQQNLSDTGQAAEGASLLDKWLDGQNPAANQASQAGSALQQQINDKARQAVRDAAGSREDLQDMENRASQQGLERGKLEFGSRDLDAEQISRNLAIKQLLDAISGSSGISSSSSEKTRFQIGEYRGYQLGGDLSLIAPPAYMYPKEMLIALYAQKKLPQYNQQARRRIKNKYVLFDKSSSMIGKRMTFAKALTNALYDDSLKKASDFRLMFFDVLPYAAIEALRNSKRDTKEEMRGYISRVKHDGGTEISEAIRAACNDLIISKPKEKTQIILVTDGEATIEASLVKKALSEANAELVVVYINNVTDSKYEIQLKDASTYFFAVNTESPDVVLKIKKSPHSG